MASKVQTLVSGTNGSFGTAGSSSALGIDGGALTVTSGNAITVFCATDIIGVTDCTDNLGNTYTKDFSEDFALHNIRLSVFRAQNITGGSLTGITVTHVSTFNRFFLACEWEGVSSLIGYNANSARSNSPNSVAAGGSGLHLFAVAATDGTNPQSSFTVPTGWTDTFPGGVPSPIGRWLGVAHKIGIASGTITGGWTQSTVDWVTTTSRTAAAGASSPLPLIGVG